MKARTPENPPDGTTARAQPGGTGRPARRLPLLLVLAGVAIIFVLLRPTPDAPQGSPSTALSAEVPRARLELRSDRLYQIGATNPFNGWMVESYPDGARRSRSAVTNGLLHGLSEGWHTNGQLQIVEHFTNGVSHGLRAKWHSDGTRASETTIVNGKIHGTFRRWHENGALSEEMEMKSGQAEGMARAYFASGFVKSRITLRDGKVVEQKFWKDGEHREKPNQTL